MVDFGAVSNWSGALPAREIRLANSQAQAMNGAVRSTLPWLEVTPASFSCPPGQEVILTVRLTNQATMLRPKTYDVTDALVIESNDEKHPVKAHLEVITGAYPLGMRTILPPRKDAAAEPAQPAPAGQSEANNG